MFRAIKKAILNNRQKAISSRYPNLRINLHTDMPAPSQGKIVELAEIVNEINLLEPKTSALSDEQLKNKTAEFRQEIAVRSKEIEPQIAQIEEELFSAAIPEEKAKIKERLRDTRNKIFEEILPEAFAVVREVSKRTIGLRHFDVQLAGGMVLHEGRIAEMATGEGKTLVATLPAYLNALLGKGVHVVTVNDYLARRDREWMGPIYEFLGLSVGVIQHDLSDEQRRHSYGCDITYGTNNEFGFDYLRDNMKYSVSDMVQRPFYYAIVDEVDSILIDEARTPLIISGPAEESTEKYYIVDKIVPKLKVRVILEKDEIDAKFKGEDLSKGFDYMIDEKAHTASLTEQGEARVCAMLNISNLHDLETMEWRHHVLQALKAHNLYRKDVEYVVKEGQVLIVDEFTGRLMPGRRWSDGLHQAVEAKEGLKIERENQTLATVTFQNYFRMYEKLSGMTGTAFTEANEFKAIYQLDVVVIPTNQPLVRKNYADRIYKTEKEKFNAVVEEIVELYQAGTPILVGTISIEKSELLSEMLKRRGIQHQVLNAKYHETEAQIIAQAGRFKAVTIATNMAGRGTDIILGGNPEFVARSIAKQKIKPDDANFMQEYKLILDKYKKEAQEEHNKVVACGGLHVLGTERHDARRIDNQLRGRCGRQGDPGSSRFSVSLEDNLMRLFGSNKLIGVMNKLGLEEGQVIEHPWVSHSIEIAQKRVEQHNFEIRKQLLEYDNVMNKQREVIYARRREILEGVALKEEIMEFAKEAVADIVSGYFADLSKGAELDKPGLLNAFRLTFGIEISAELINEANKEATIEDISEAVAKAYDAKEATVGKDLTRFLEHAAFLQIIDAKWKEHLYAMDNLREGIGLRAYGQRDPLVEYKREGFQMFSEMMYGIEREVVEVVFKMQPAKPERVKGVFSEVAKSLVHNEVEQFGNAPAPQEEDINPADVETKNEPKPIAQAHAAPKVGRNDPCPCGSNKKFKKCCGK